MADGNRPLQRHRTNMDRRFQPQNAARLREPRCHQLPHAGHVPLPLRPIKALRAAALDREELNRCLPKWTGCLPSRPQIAEHPSCKAFFDPVAQLVEQYTFNVWALGSNPSGITKLKPKKSRTDRNVVRLF